MTNYQKSQLENVIRNIRKLKRSFENTNDNRVDNTVQCLDLLQIIINEENKNANCRWNFKSI